MADVTINYEGNAIATMSASGTKTLLTEGKYCTDDIEVVYVSPGGGGNTEHVTFTPATNTLSFTVSALAGTVLEHLVFKPSGVVSTVLNHSTRVLGFGYIDFTSGSENYFSEASNSGGSGFGQWATAATAGSASTCNFVRTTGVISSLTGAGGGYLLGGITYEILMW